MPSVPFHCIRIWLQVALVFLLAGCWQKIEYTGTSSSAATSASQESSKSSAIPASDSTQATTAGSSRSDVTGGGTSNADDHIGTVVEPPASARKEASQTKADDDRYAIPATSESANAASKPAPSSTQPGVSEQQQPAAPHTDATPASATADVGPKAASPNVRRAAWRLGSRLSLAALAHDRGAAPKDVPAWIEEARSAAKLLGTSVPDLPEPAATSETAPASGQVLDFLVHQYQRIFQDLSQQQGREIAALFEIALKSNTLLLLYRPGSATTNSISAAISQAAPQARLPAELWKPLVDVLGKQSSLADVQAAIRQMHNDVDRYLANPAEPIGR